MSDAAKRLRDARRALRAAVTLLRKASRDAMSPLSREVVRERACYVEAYVIPRVSECMRAAEIHCSKLRRKRREAA